MKFGSTILCVSLLATGVILIAVSAAGDAAGQATPSSQAELERLRALNDQLKVRVAELEAALANETAVRQKERAVRETATKALEAMRQELAAMQKQVAQVHTERDKNLNSVVELTDQLHQAFQQIKQLKEENARLSALVPQTAEADKSAKLDGVVLSVAGGGQIEVALGADRGLRVGHRLTVYRVSGQTTTPLGQVDVVNTAPDKAVCKVDPKSLKGAIQKGDRVRLGEPPAPGAGGPPNPAEPPHLVDGEVLSVGAEGEVEISFGAANGLRPGHRLEVYRLTGSEGIYIGRVEVVKTTTKTSTCQSILEFQRHPIRKGDRVTSRL